MIENFLPEICALLDRQTAGLQSRDIVQPEKLLKKFLDHLEQA